ncbi:helix-turn-helix transcriptional regulator [Microtetraspora sp. NBRC 13810]|uniref:helix-turn-helix transcriptional regulator n=1 Tax=Microtetraspora sp. NBRC 13810 TaxID=3030990 RepID=UPI002555CEA2|nr:helix-turn-helix transcriptional regulator [Microtetraspora sp. NBRC 13810]
MESDRLLGEFLHARRRATTPAQAGLDVGASRPRGLLREEVAMLAGVSTAYYIRLEQGRERHPSRRVINSLARVLGLDPEATAHLHELARLPQRQRVHGRPEAVRPILTWLIRSQPYTATLVVNRWMDVLAANPLATALYDGLECWDNLTRLAFLDPAAHDFYHDWEDVARIRVANLRAAAVRDPEHPYLTELVGELTRESADFRRLWARGEMFDPSCTGRRLHHREVGELDLSCGQFQINRAPGQQLFSMHAEPGSASAQRLVLLGSLAGTV